jgi:hypothetical protein
MYFKARAIFFLGVIVSLAGCANYQLGTATKASFSTLYVEPVESQTTLPQARALVSTQVREAFARDGRVALVNSPDEADAILSVTLVSYDRDVASVRENDTGLARKFTLTFDASCALRTRSGEVLFDERIVRVRRDAFSDGGQLQSEFQTLPLLAQALADKIRHAVLDVW